LFSVWDALGQLIEVGFRKPVASEYQQRAKGTAYLGFAQTKVLLQLWNDALARLGRERVSLQQEARKEASKYGDSARR
jgi:hypothetical protein